MKQYLLGALITGSLAVAALAQEPVWDGNKVVLESQQIADGVIVIQHVNAAAYIDTHLEADKAFMIQNFGQGRGIEEVVETEVSAAIKDGLSLGGHGRPCSTARFSGLCAVRLGPP